MSKSIDIKIADSLNTEALDKFVYENPYTSIFQTPDMAEVCRRDKKSTPLVLAAVDEDTGEIVASLLARIKEEKRGFLSSFSRHSTIRGGPIFRDNEQGVAAVSKLLQYYNEITKKDALYSRIYPLNDTPQLKPAYERSGYEYEGWNNILIDLSRPINEIRAKLSRGRKSGINKAIKSGVILEEIEDIELISTFCGILNETYKIRKIPLEDISLLKAVFDVLVPQKKAKFLLLKYENRYIASLLVLLYKDIIYGWHGGSTQNEKDLRLHANDLKIWNIIKWGHDNGFHVFDFGGAGLSSETNPGWVNFKRGFGGRLVNYGRYTKIHQLQKLWFSEKMFKVYRKLILR